MKTLLLFAGDHLILTTLIFIVVVAWFFPLFS